MNVAQLLDEAAERYGERTAIAFEGETISYAELADASSCFAGGLQERGIRPGDRVAVDLPNLPQFVVVIWGIFKAGAIPSPMNPQMRRREIAHQLQDSQAKMIVALVQVLDEVEAATRQFPQLQIITAGGESRYPRFRHLLKGQPTFVDRQDDDLALLPYTSGTTGRPKGVLLSHGNLSSNIKTVSQLYDQKGPAAEEDRLLVPIPMYHITGMTVLMLTPLARGATIYPMLRWDAREALRLIQAEQISDFLAVPTIYIDLLHHPRSKEYDLSSLKLCSSGGARLPVAVMEAFEERFGVPIYEGYGLTETSPVTHTNLAAPHRKPGTIGWPIPGAECKIVDDQGQALPPGQTGELLVRGPMVMQGYHNNPEATRQAIDPDGFFHTGDLAQLDEEGYYHIVDRIKDMINVAGLKVFPKEVEKVLYEHPDVAECAVVGIPDERKGETVKAYVLLKPGVGGTEKLAADMQQYCLDQLSAYKHPRQIEFVKTLPKTGSGKIQKYRLREEQ